MTQVAGTFEPSVAENVAREHRNELRGSGRTDGLSGSVNSPAPASAHSLQWLKSLRLGAPERQLQMWITAGKGWWQRRILQDPAESPYRHDSELE
jgi:hypothetical protein